MHAPGGLERINLDASRESSLKEVESKAMKNPVIYYLIIALGVVALAVGAFYLFKGGHPAREIAGLVAGVILLIAGIAGTFMTRSRGAIS